MRTIHQKNAGITPCWASCGREIEQFVHLLDTVSRRPKRENTKKSCPSLSLTKLNAECKAYALEQNNGATYSTPQAHVCLPNPAYHLQVLSHIADRLKDLHTAGYVHRDIKPGNIMFLTRTKRWTLIDFGCAARTGSQVHTGFSLLYAAPEALKAYLEGEGGLRASEALDAWSLGVLAIELLTGQQVFNHMHPKEEVRRH